MFFIKLTNLVQINTNKLVQLVDNKVWKHLNALTKKKGEEYFFRASDAIYFEKKGIDWFIRSPL